MVLRHAERAVTFDHRSGVAPGPAAGIEHARVAETVYAVVGLALLATAMSAALFLITDLLYESFVAAGTAAALGLGVALFWFVVPFAYRHADA